MTEPRQGPVGTWQPHSIFVQCPHCHEPLMNPLNGMPAIDRSGLYFLGGAEAEVRCEKCGGRFFLPPITGEMAPRE